ncbi:hypothetical protein AS9A_1057 [Hoyosella subflava DQS3-9A1]|uniref:Uncharacterized protein n=1 Tax=Hoyosella subflava (strain DSM 45089 / JCM 17490 / NBRC 109087 / DQS3-9A1) TaxID=443218 RepID=F6EQ86_HOYSD|nr:hypothetical protein AS9A_1057 [Hoyosella subflava DQS3-9A1]
MAKDVGHNIHDAADSEADSDAGTTSASEPTTEARVAGSELEEQSD